MAITTERLPGARVSMQIEVDPDLVEKHMEKAVTRISKQVKIPGFRPGKANRRVIEQRHGDRRRSSVWNDQHAIPRPRHPRGDVVRQRGDIR